MKLYYGKTSPYARKVLVLLHETKQLQDVELIDSTNPGKTPIESVAANNPLSKVPTLVRPDGPSLYDSRVICRYLDHRAGGKFYPGENRLWETLTLETTGDGVMDAALLITYEGRLRPEEKQWDGWIDQQWEKVAAACSALNARWMSHLAGPLGIGHISVACALSYLDLRHDARNWRRGNDALSTWHEKISQRSSMKSTDPAN